ncbi:MAG: cell division protein ZapE [Gammaproteobacteria bacterium]|nr:cell division protein ZapE [Gammaproteobacteria bacterium]
MNVAPPESSPAARYEADLAREGFAADPAQARAVEALQALWLDLQDAPHPSLFDRLKSALQPGPVEREPVTGLYLWGGVGRGKTYLMDAFFHSLPFAEKRRQHFHRFMYDVHARLKRLKHLEDPLKRVAQDISRDTRVICFDEFFVSDIADAMILGRLLDWLFNYGVTLVATSNVKPDDLYRDGLQRARFLPAIELLKRHVRVLNVDGGVDYRLRVLEMAEIYHYPLDDAADENLEHSFNAMCPDPEDIQLGGSIEIEGRDIPIVKCGEGVAWFEFAALCEGPRSAADYIEIARLFNTVLLANVPQLDSLRENEARRFITLIDELYDHQVKLMISAEVAMEDLYIGNRLKFEFQRTLSRLQEMQSHQYLALPHNP